MKPSETKVLTISNQEGGGGFDALCSNHTYWNFLPILKCFELTSKTSNRAIQIIPIAKKLIRVFFSFSVAIEVFMLSNATMFAVNTFSYSSWNQNKCASQLNSDVNEEN